MYIDLVYSKRKDYDLQTSSFLFGLGVWTNLETSVRETEVERSGSTVTLRPPIMCPGKWKTQTNFVSLCHSLTTLMECFSSIQHAQRHQTKRHSTLQGHSDRDYFCGKAKRFAARWQLETTVAPGSLWWQSGIVGCLFHLALWSHSNLTYLCCFQLFTPN